MAAVAALAAGVVALDQFTKAVALSRLVPGLPIDVVDGLLALTLVMNPGLAFGLLGGLPTAWRWVVAGLSVVALLILARIALRLPPTGGRIAHLAVGCIFGGAVGNLIDRARFGAVVDFVDISLGRYHWPAFNVADSAITIGVALLALRLLEKPSAAPQT
jgi:signal peptidase II